MKLCGGDHQQQFHHPSLFLLPQAGIVRLTDSVSNTAAETAAVFQGVVKVAPLPKGPQRKQLICICMRVQKYLDALGVGAVLMY